MICLGFPTERHIYVIFTFNMLLPHLTLPLTPLITTYHFMLTSNQILYKIEYIQNNNQIHILRYLNQI